MFFQGAREQLPNCSLGSARYCTTEVRNMGQEVVKWSHLATLPSAVTHWTSLSAVLGHGGREWVESAPHRDRESFAPLPVGLND